MNRREVLWGLGTLVISFSPALACPQKPQVVEVSRDLTKNVTEHVSANGTKVFLFVLTGNKAVRDAVVADICGTGIKRVTVYIDPKKDRFAVIGE